jgi:chromosome segregation ATPase
LAEAEAKAQDLRSHKDSLATRCQALDGEIVKLRDKMAARMAELQKLTEEHAVQRLEWATRLRDSETQSAKAQGMAETLAARIKALEHSNAHLESVRAKLHETQLLLARCETEKRMVEEEKKRVQAELAEKEDVLFEGLRAVRELQRQTRRGKE